MKTTAKRTIVVLVLVAVVIGGMGFLGFKFAVNGEKWATLRANAHLTKNGSFIAAGNITDKNGEVLAYTKNNKRLYNDDEEIRRSTLHIVGDTEGYISSGVQTAYKTRLIGYNPFTGIYSLKKYGRGNDVSLTIDSKVCAEAYNKLDGRKGVVAAYDYKTGKLICSVSSPNYDILDKPTEKEINEDKEGKFEGLYMNRLIDGLYTPGSTFKIITTTSVVENMPDYENWEYTCKGETTVGGVKVTCPHRHGKINFKECLANSCNCGFAELSAELGKEKLTATATEYGFGKSFPFGNQQTAKSIFDLSNASVGDTAWASVGQYTTLVNPYHMLTVLGAIGNDGTAVLPYAVESVTTPSGKVVEKAKTETVTYITPEVSKTVSDLMRNTVKTHYGDYNFKNLDMCGKTGTAEVGDDKKPHSWFMGFSQNKDCPVAIVVVIENGGWGSSNAIPVASRVMSEIYKSYSEK